MKAAPSIKWTDLAILVFVVAACAIPFLNQPFHMDDNFYMDMARNVQVNPLFPNDAPYIFEGILRPDMGSHSHPPFQTYFLAALQSLFGEGSGKEWIYHLSALLFPILAVLSFYFIAAFYVARPLWPSLMLACSPLFLVMQHTLMTDIPMLSFWLAAIAAFHWAIHRNKTVFFAASVFFQTAAMFTSYQSFALTPLLGFYQLRRGQGKKGWIFLIIAPAAVLVWYALSCLHYDRLLWKGTLEFVQSRHPLSLDVLWIKLSTAFEYQGWLIIFPFFVFYVLARNLKGRLLILVLLAAGGAAQLAVSEYRLVDKGIFIIGLAAGFFILLEMTKFAFIAALKSRVRLGLERIDRQFISLWYFMILAYCIIFLTEGSARYTLPLVPPFLLYYFKILEESEVSEYRVPPRFINSAMLASGSLVISLIWGLVLSHADREFARIYPRAAQQVTRMADAVNSYCAGEWGFRYYMKRAGIRTLPADESAVRGGDFIAVPKLALPYEIPSGLRSMTMPVRTLSFKPNTTLRMLDTRTPAGFYSSGWGLIPLSFSRKALEEIEILQVNFMVEQLPWAQTETESHIEPWPGYLKLQDQEPLCIIVKPGTRIQYRWPVHKRIQLELLCGVSPDSYADQSGTFGFEIRQLSAGGAILAESGITLRPGINVKDRVWRPIRMVLTPAPEGVLEFYYYDAQKNSAGAGAFARSILMPVVDQ
jgi:4-amino-4-deoxy-L-arabinose transferase-like glycosyltransferase